MALGCNRVYPRFEIIPFDPIIADEYITRGVNLVWMNELPTRISETPGWFNCKWCDHRPVCHLNAAPTKTCRSCIYGAANSNGNWYCDHEDKDDTALTKEMQYEACKLYERLF